MASIRSIKKDIDYLVSEVISDCYTYLYLHANKNDEKIVAIIEEVVKERNDLIDRVNNPDKDADRKQNKKHYRQIRTDLLAMIDESFSKLSNLIE